MIAKQRKVPRSPVNPTWIKKQGGLLDACLRALRWKKPSLANDYRRVLRRDDGKAQTSTTNGHAPNQNGEN